MSKYTAEEVRGAVARGWCHPSNSHKEMDSDLALAISDEVMDMLTDEREVTSIADAIQEEIKRVREVLIPAYEEIGLAGQPAIYMMNMSLDAATKALAEGDCVAIIQCYQDLKDYTR